MSTPLSTTESVKAFSRIARTHQSLLLAGLFGAEVVALTVLQVPNELFVRFAFLDSGTILTIQDLIRRGYRPTLDFGYIYGLLPLLIDRVWLAVWGATPRAIWAAILVCNLAMAWGLARFAAAQRIGWAGVALLALAMPDLLRSSYDVLVQALEPALLVHALAEQGQGRRDRALAFVTAAAFVKPSMAYLFGLYLLIAIALTTDWTDRTAWRSNFGPALVTGSILVAVLAAVYGVRPMLNTLTPLSGMKVYRQSRYGFFNGIGRDFWYRPGAGLRGYVRYEIGYWLAGTLVLVAGGLGSLWRIARRIPPRVAYNDEVVLGRALSHVAFVTAFFGHRFSWKYYHALFLAGLTALTPRGRGHAVVIAFLAVLVLITDKAWVQAVAHDWKTRSPSPAMLGLWATPAEQQEWERVLALTRDQPQPPVLLARCEGAALLFPRFAPPMGAYFVPGHPLPAEVRRKADELAAARLIVVVGSPDDRWFARWPELAAALDGCEPVWVGKEYEVCRRVRPPRRSPPSFPLPIQSGVPPERD
jgi:hypothetical protein